MNTTKNNPSKIASVLKHELYNITYQLTTKRYKDSDWSGVYQIFDMIELYIAKFNTVRGTDFTFKYYVDGSGYHHSSDGLSILKQYNIVLTDEDENIEYKGTCNCHFCGTIENPFEMYDIVLLF